jgi:PAS domain S-box-containing protein
MTLPDLLTQNEISAVDWRQVVLRHTAGIFMWRADADRVWWSDTIFASLGYGPGGNAGYEDIEALLHPDDREPMREAVERSREAYSDYEMELRLRNADGVFQPFRVAGSWVGDPSRPVLVGFLTDLTEEKAATAEKDRMSALFKSFFEQAPAAVFIKDKNGHHLFGNAQAAEITGVSLEAFLTKPPLELFGAETAKQLMAVDETVLKTGKPREWTGDIVTASGETRHVFDTKFRVVDPVSGQEMVGGFGIDISKQYEAEKALAASQRLEALGQLVSGVAHDFNNLLAVIQGNLELVLDANGHSEHREMLDDALDSARNGAALTKQLLAFGRRSMLQITHADLNDIVERFCGILRRTFPETIEIRHVPGAGLGGVELDLAQAESALLNCAINARDAMPDGGVLTIETYGLTVREGEAGELAPGRYSVAAISDTGAGMQPEVLARAFEPFFTTKASGEGTGMGLAMVYGLMKQLGGLVEIVSQPGEGATVRLYFPAHDGALHPISGDRAQAAPGGAETILLVEDNPQVRAMLQRQVESLGYDVRVAGDGEQALRQLEADRVDLVLTDIVMPGGVSGYQLADRVRARGQDLPFIFLSGYAEEASRLDTRFRTGDQLLLKPADLEALAAALRQGLDPA